MSFTERRVRLERPRVHYRAGAQIYWGDLIFDEDRPVLVVSWRTLGLQRVPYVSFALDAALLSPHPKRNGDFFYRGDLLRTGKTTPSSRLAQSRSKGRERARAGRSK